jgi:CheY-like chemotaxis protein
MDGYTVLCVDDDEDDLLFIKEAIKLSGSPLQIIEAKNGWEAFNYLKKKSDSEELPGLIIMDMNMPRMNGKQAISMIKGDLKLKLIPIAIFTTSASDADKEYFENLGIHFITKPFDYTVFVKKIIELLDDYNPKGQ